MKFGRIIDSPEAVTEDQATSCVHHDGDHCELFVPLNDDRNRGQVEYDPLSKVLLQKLRVEGQTPPLVPDPRLDYGTIYALIVRLHERRL